MSFLTIPVCDRCGMEGYKNQQFAQVKIVGSGGCIRTMDLCGACECLLDGWMELPKKRDERGNCDGTD